jgi:large subunit ribosomal protein L24
MKKLFSSSWKKSIQKRKQIKYSANAPLHIKKKFLSANIGKALRTKLGIRTLGLKKGDRVKVMRGKFRKHEGVVVRVDVKLTRVFVEGAENVKKDGTKVFYPLNPSNLQLVEIDLDDKHRKKILERKNAKKAS